jgi:hypothetical protein
MTNATADIKAIDSILHSWGKWVKDGGSVRHLGFPSASPFVLKTGGVTIEDSILLEVDHQVGRLSEPFKRIIKRQYIDARSKASKHKYFPENRSQYEQAQSERMTVSEYADVLRMARNRLIGALQQIM